MSSSFSLGWGKLDPVECRPHTRRSQSDHGGGRETDGRASSLNQGSGGGTGLRDGLTAFDGRSEKAHESKRVEFAPLKLNRSQDLMGYSTHQ